MSKKQSSQETPEIFNGGYLLKNWNIQNLEGRLLTIIESLGLRESQEGAVKNIIQQEMWKLYELEPISDKICEDIYEFNRERRKKNLIPTVSV